MLNQIKATFGTSNEPTQLQRAAEASGFRQTTALDRVKQRLGLQEKTELQEMQESMCPALTYEQVRAWPTRAAARAVAAHSLTPAPHAPRALRGGR